MLLQTRKWLLESMSLLRWQLTRVGAAVLLMYFLGRIPLAQS